MRVSNLNASVLKMPFVNTFKNSSISYISSPFLKPLSADIVTFSGKSYNAGSIKTRTGHCAYCDTKIYTEEELSRIASDISSSSGEELRGHLKSVLGKLGEKTDDADLSLERKRKNKKYIEFFNKIKNASYQDNELTAEEILQDLEPDFEATDIIFKNLNPLLSTLDHVSPQNLNLPHQNDDINLVEACFTCGQIKAGRPFADFYKRYPSIKFIMPFDKFNFAIEGGLVEAEDQLDLDSTADALIGRVDLLQGQKNDLLSKILGIDYHISACTDKIKSMITNLDDEKEAIRRQLEVAEAQIVDLKDDEDFIILNQKKQTKLELKQNEDKLEKARVKLSEVNLQATAAMRKKSKKSDRKAEDKVKGRLEELAIEDASIRSSIDVIQDSISACEERYRELLQIQPDINDLLHQRNALQAELNANERYVGNEKALSTLRPQVQTIQDAYEENSKSMESGEFGEYKKRLRLLQEKLYALEADQVNIEAQPRTGSNDDLKRWISELNQRMSILKQKEQALTAQDNAKKLQLKIDVINKTIERLYQKLRELESAN